jgi:hypothetical protein
VEQEKAAGGGGGGGGDKHPQAAGGQSGGSLPIYLALLSVLYEGDAPDVRNVLFHG